MFCGHQPFILAPKLCLRHKPFCHQCPLCSAGFVWRHGSWPMPRLCLGLCSLGHPHPPPALLRLLRLSVGASAPCCRPAAARPSVSPGGGPRPWAALQGEAGGRQGKHGPQRGARNSADSALLRPGRGSASPWWRPQGQGSPPPPPPLPCLRPPAGCGASPAAKDSGQGCWRQSSPHPLPQSIHSPCITPLQPAVRVRC